MEEESVSLDTSFSLSRPDGDPVAEDAYSSTSSPSGLKLRLIKRNSSLRSASSNGNNNDPKSGPTTPLSAVKNRPRQGTKNRSSTGSSSSSPTSNSVNSSSSKKLLNNQPTTSDGKKIVYLPPCDDDVTTNRDILTRLPENEGSDLYVGDIIWSKVSGYPWWPCMITIDPYTGKYSKLGASTDKPLYHVQYFGSKALRSYTSPGSTMPFEGREKYDLEIDRIKNTPGTQKALRKQALNRLVIKPSFKKEWKFACDEAEEALKLDREKRIKELTFVYIRVKDEKSPTSKDDVKTPKSAKKNKKPENPLNVYDFSDGDEDFDDEGTSPTLCLWSAKRANRKGDYDIYVTQTRSKVMEENPDSSESEIEHMLKTRWNNMSDDLKAKYCIREVNGEEDKTPISKKKTSNGKKPENEKSPRGRKRKNDVTVKPANQSNGDVSMVEGNGNVSENESALVIADMTTPKKSRRSKGETDGSVKRSAKSTEIIKSPKEVKPPKTTPKSSRSNRTPKEEKDSSIKSEGTLIKSTPSKSKVKDEVKESSSPRKRPSSTPVDKSAATSEKPKRPRKSTIKENGQSTEKEKTPKSQEKTKGKGKQKETKDVDMMEKQTDQYKNNKENDKEKEKNNSTTSSKRKSVVHQIDSVESEETRTSEDASSLSEIEANENRELNDRVCEKCNEEALENYIQCSGLCLKYYHNNCLPKTFNSETLQCQECSSDSHSCFICDSHSSDVKKCSDSKCGKFYHLKCLQNGYPHKMIKDENNEGFICPLHSCLTCYVEHQDDQIHSYMKKRLLKCLKCPTAYHLTDDCLSAGSITISFSYIICPEHIPAHKHINVNWCFSCNSGGSLICCERCPSAFHQACLETPLPEGNFFCGDCVVRKQLHYNDIVWVKLGPHRWWPSKVCHPKNCPDNVMALSHSVGEFPVYFFGSHDYYWIHRGKAFPFVEGDLTKAPALGKNAKKDFRKAISEAIEAFTSWQEARKNALNRKIKPPSYVYLRVNKRVGKAPKVSPSEDHDTEPIVCQCKSDAEHPCGVDEDCFNRLTLIECDPVRCNAGDKCQNRRFRKREYAKVQPFKTESRGWGLKALQDIKKGTFVIEYVGELIDEAECENRIKNMIEKHEPNFYFLTIDRDTIIDAGPKGNLARFMNHSCSPNCETQKWVVGGITRVGLFAIQDIPQGAELTFNYNLHCRGNEKTACNCGAKNCSGFLGVRPNKIPDEESSKKQTKNDKIKPKPKPKNLHKKEFESFHEDECFKCREGGELVMCDKRKCPKSYHLPCLKLTKLPRGVWFCPWHHCDMETCGKASTKFCDMCPTSFCNDHGDDLLNQNDKGLQVCYEHLSSDEISSSNELAKTSESTKEIKENGDTNHQDDIDSSSVIETKHEKVIESDKIDDVEENNKDQSPVKDEIENMEIDSTEDQITEEKDKEVMAENAIQDEPVKVTEESEPEPVVKPEPELQPELQPEPESEGEVKQELEKETEVTQTEVRDIDNEVKESIEEEENVTENQEVHLIKDQEPQMEKTVETGEENQIIVTEEAEKMKDEPIQDQEIADSIQKEDETKEVGEKSEMATEELKEKVEEKNDEIVQNSSEELKSTKEEDEEVKSKEETTTTEATENEKADEPVNQLQPEAHQEPQPATG